MKAAWINAGGAGCCALSVAGLLWYTKARQTEYDRRLAELERVVGGAQPVNAEGQHSESLRRSEKELLEKVKAALRVTEA